MTCAIPHTTSNNKRKRPMRNQEMEELQMLAMPQPFLTIVKNDRHTRVEVHLRGEFKSPQECTQQLSELYQLSEQYPICCVFINSNGGRVDLLMEIVNILKKFDKVITIVTSNAASAGLMLWSVGDIRVVCPHAELMAHRETSGYIDKTDALIDRAAFLKRRFDALFVELCGGVLLPDEMDKARSGEVWLLGEDMIERGAAISWDQFHVLDTTPVEALNVFMRGEETFVEVGGVILKAELMVDDSAEYDMLELMYGMPDARMEFPVDEEEQSEEENEENAPSSGVFESEEDFRSFFREHFGKGNYRIVFQEDIEGWAVEVKVDGKWHLLFKEDCCLKEEFFCQLVEDVEYALDNFYERMSEDHV